MDTQLGLPKIVVDLISMENVKFGDNLTWKVISNQGFTELILTWDKTGANYSPKPVQLPMFNQQENINNRYGHTYGYRKKTPSELKRDQRRKQDYMQRQSQKKKVSSNNGERSNDTKDIKVCVDAAVNTVPARSFDQISPCKSSKNTHKQTVPVIKGNMKTRSMTRNDMVSP